MSLSKLSLQISRLLRSSITHLCTWHLPVFDVKTPPGWYGFVLACVRYWPGRGFSLWLLMDVCHLLLTSSSYLMFFCGDVRGTLSLSGKVPGVQSFYHIFFPSLFFFNLSLTANSHYWITNDRYSLTSQILAVYGIFDSSEYRNRQEIAAYKGINCGGTAEAMYGCSLKIRSV